VIGCTQNTSPTMPSSPSSGTSFSLSGGASSSSSVGTEAARNDRACWGEATQALAQLGEMGAHGSEQSTPRLGLRHVARALFEQGVIPDDSLQALGAFLSSAFGLSIESCL